MGQSFPGNAGFSVDRAAALGRQSENDLYLPNFVRKFDKSFACISAVGCVATAHFESFCRFVLEEADTSTRYKSNILVYIQ